MKNWLQTEIRSQTGAFTLTWLDSLNRGPDSPLLLARRPRLLDVLEVLNVQMNEIKKIELFLCGILSKSKNIKLRRRKM